MFDVFTQCFKHIFLLSPFVLIKRTAEQVALVRQVLRVLIVWFLYLPDFLNVRQPRNVVLIRAAIKINTDITVHFLQESEN